MSARQAFTDAATPRTTFAGGVSPWPEALYAPKKSHKKKPVSPESKMNTAHLSVSPFHSTSARVQAAAPAAPAASTKEAAKKNPGPPKGTLCRARVDMAGLQIVKGMPLPKTLTTSNYAQRFATMEPRDAIRCKPAEVVSVANAMRKWLKDEKKSEQFQVISEKQNPDDPDVGHVWLWPASDIKSLPSKSRGGVVLGQKRKAEKDAQ